MLKIRIETKNQAFKDDLRRELMECLKQVEEKIFLDCIEGVIHDTYGNKVGNFKLTNR